MPISGFARGLVLLASVFVLSPSLASAHEMTLGGSKWCFGSHGILATIELGSSLFPEIEGIKKSRSDLAAVTDAELQQMAADTIQPYIHRKLSLTVNGQPYPLKVTRMEREGTLWKIRLSAEGVMFDGATNPVAIDYRLLFEEMHNEHVNVAYMYLADATPETVQEVFDRSHPELQYTFEPQAHVWKFSIEGR